jgi:hypothetical protein
VKESIENNGQRAIGNGQSAIGNRQSAISNQQSAQAQPARTKRVLNGKGKKE